ncbi:MAG: nucleotidyltransferase domain-containing protein, partial [Pseudomonadota bacterium]
MDITELRRYKPQIQNLANSYKISPDSIRVFGSVARGDNSKNSDIDFLIHPLPDCSLFDLGSFYEEMTELLGKVDIVPDDSVRPLIK